MSDYRPTEHDGLRQDGQPDQRVGTGEFAHGKVDPHEAGKKGGHTSGTGYSENDSDDTGYNNRSSNNRSSGNNNNNNSSRGEFAHGKVDPHEAGKKGGRSSGTGSSEHDSRSSGYEDNNRNSSGEGGDYKPTEHDGLRKDGKPDGRVKGNY